MEGSRTQIYDKDNIILTGSPFPVDPAAESFIDGCRPYYGGNPGLSYGHCLYAEVS